VPQEEAADDATVAPPAPEEDVRGHASPATLSSSTSSLRPRIESRGAKRKISAAEFESELKRVYAELDESRAALQLKDSENTTLKKRNTTLVAQVASASDAVRASRTAARDAQTSARASMKEAGSEAVTLSCLLERTEAELADARRQIGNKEMEMKKQSSEYKTKLDEAIRIRVLTRQRRRQRYVLFYLLFYSSTHHSF
jgi:phage-related tail protein